MTTSANGGRQRIALDGIAIPANVRELNSEHVDALAASIKLRGLLVPVIVRQAGEDFELVAGFHRFAAHNQLARSTSTSTSAPARTSTGTGRSRTSHASSLIRTRRPVPCRRCSPTD